MSSLGDIINVFNNLKQFSDGKNWIASQNGGPLEIEGDRAGVVENVGVGSDGPLFDPRVWVRARFKIDGVECELRNEHEVARNHDSIAFTKGGTNVPVTSSRFVLSNRIVGTEFRIVIEYVFTDASGAQRFRFDGTGFDASSLAKGAIIGSLI